MTTIPTSCENCGKPLGLFDGRFCGECIQQIRQALNEVKHEPTQPQDGDRAISLEAAIEAIRHADVNFSVVSEIDFTKHKREVQEIINNILDAQEKMLKQLPKVTMEEKAISLNAVIDALVQSINILEAEDRIRDLPSVKPQEPRDDATLKDIFCMGCEYKEQEPKWIPVSERLPEEFQRVLVTIVNYNGNKVVRVAEYYNRRKGVFQIKENHEQWEIGEKGLLAWMPLPAPYEPQESEV